MGHYGRSMTPSFPLLLPETDDYRPGASDDKDAVPVPALARVAAEWRFVEIDGIRYERELNTMPQWAGSCWYYLRFTDPHNDQAMADSRAERYWMGESGVDLYVGGVEHAVLHLLYARFWHKVLFDLGHVSTPEPFSRLFNQGMILSDAFRDERGVYVPADKVEERDGKWWYDGQTVERSPGRMGKSKKNGVNPDDFIEEFGVDSLRLYEMFMGPLDASKPWTTRDTVGIVRFLYRLWRNFVDPETGEALITEEEASPALRRFLHRSIKAVTEDMESLGFNTAVARYFELNNELVALDRVPRGSRWLRADPGPDRAAHRRRTVGADRPHRVGGIRPVARVRRGARRRRHRDHGGASRRQGEGSHRGLGRYR